MLPILRIPFRIATLATALMPLLVGVAQAAPIEAGTVTFENLDTPPFYFKATVDYEIYAPGDPASPIPSATDYNYIYKLTNLLVAPPTGQINVPLDTLQVGLGSSAIVNLATGLGDAGAVTPSAVTPTPTKIGFSFATTTVNPGGAPSDRLALLSAYGPGDVNATVGLSSFVDDQILRGPAVLPQKTFPCFDVNKAEVELETNKAGHDEFKIEKGILDLAVGDTFDPATDVVKLEINDGLLTETIPAGSFEQKGTKPKFKFKSGSGVTPKVHVHLNLDKGEWEFKIKKTDLAAFAGVTSLKIVLVIGDTMGEVTVPVTEKVKSHETEYEFKHSPKLACVAETPTEEAKRSCLSFVEVTYQNGTPAQEALQKFSDEIGHPETTFVAGDGASATFHTSCSQCLVCGQPDASGLFELTGISDATGRLGQKCGVPDASCGTTPPPPPAP